MALLALGVAAITLATLVPIPGGRSVPGICVICGTLGGSDFISNVILFAPFGFALAWRGHPLWRAALIAGAFSLAVETAQIALITGRDASLGDLIANTTGACIGWAAGFHRAWWLRRDREMRRCIGVTAIILASITGGLALFTPSLPDSTYFLQWTMRFRGMSVYDGAVRSTRIGPLILSGPGSIERTDSVRAMLFSEPLEAVVTAGPPPPTLAPIVSIYDDAQRRIMLLGAVEDDLVLQYRTLADNLRLDHADLRVRGMFRHVTAGNTFGLTSMVSREGYCFEVEGERECGRGFTAGDTWSLLQSVSLDEESRVAIGAIWLWAVFLPAGFLATRKRTLAAATLLAMVALAVVPVLLGFVMTPLPQLFGAAAGLVSGGLVARYAKRREMESPSRASAATRDP